MALAAGTIWEVQTGGSDTACSGGFNPTNSNFPTDGAVSSATTAAPVFSSASYNFVAGDVGHWIYIKSGTNSIPGWYKIASVASNQATLTATIGTAVLAAGTPNTATGCGTSSSLTSQTWGIDYSQSTSAKISFTDMVIGGTTTQFTSALNPVGKNFVGNLIKVTAGTGFTVQTVEVVSTSGTTATCDQSLGTTASTGGTGYMGGAFASPGQASSIAVSGNDVFVQSGTYTVNVNSVNVSNGKLSLAGGSVTDATRLIGYGTVRGDGGTKPSIKGSGVTGTLATIGGNYTEWTNLELDANSISTFSIFNDSGSYCRVSQCKFKNINGSVGGVIIGPSAQISACEFDTSTNGSLVLKLSGQATGLYFHNINGYAAYIIGAATLTDSIIASVTNAASTDAAIYCAASAFLVRNVSIYSSNKNGVYVASGWGTFENVVVSESGLYGFNAASSGNYIVLRNCAGYSNTSGNVNANILSSTGFVTLSGSPYTNAASSDFSLNSTAGAGAACRAAGIPGVFPGGLTTGYLDIGAVQSAGGGGGAQIIGSSIIGRAT